MSVWFAIPSKRTPEQVDPIVRLWRERGYKVALFRDHGDAVIACDLLLSGPYKGYAASVNLLCREVLAEDPEAEYIVSGGDDTEPDPNKTAEEIARECTDHFSGTFGVMQPTGDRWGECEMSRRRWPDAPAYIDRIAGSPWMGREFCQQIYHGRGPFREEFFHMYSDEFLQRTAQHYGIFWQRRDLTHLHRHWGREGSRMPDFLREVNSPKHWREAKAIFDRLIAEGFPAISQHA